MQPKRVPEPHRDVSEVARPSRGRPIDLVHLAAQTLGDRELEREILGLMSGQIEHCAARIGAASVSERHSLAHTLKGAARNIGAFGLAERAQSSEDRPADDLATAALLAEMRRTATFIQLILG